MLTDREFSAFYNGLTGAAPPTPVFIGMTQYENAASHAAASPIVFDFSKPEAATFAGSIERFDLGTNVQPLVETDFYDLAQVSAVADNAMEIAVRNLTIFGVDNQDDYNTKRLAFSDAIKQQDGFVAEYQWKSVLSPELVVAFTVFEDTDEQRAVGVLVPPEHGRTVPALSHRLRDVDLIEARAVEDLLLVVRAANHLLLDVVQQAHAQ